MGPERVHFLTRSQVPLLMCPLGPEFEKHWLRGKEPASVAGFRSSNPSYELHFPLYTSVSSSVRMQRVTKPT